MISGVYGRGSTYCALEILLKGGAREKGPLNTMNLDHLRTIQARGTYANHVLTMVAAGGCFYAQHIQPMFTRSLFRIRNPHLHGILWPLRIPRGTAAPQEGQEEIHSD
jgi:hypothetical protein